VRILHAGLFDVGREVIGRKAKADKVGDRTGADGQFVPMHGLLQNCAGN
jgi:hypothetical protein